MASTVKNGIDRLRNGNQLRRGPGNKESTYNSEEHSNCLIVKMDSLYGSQVWAFLRLQTEVETSMTTRSLPFESLGIGCKLPMQTYFGLATQRGGGRRRVQRMSA